MDDTGHSASIDEFCIIDNAIDEFCIIDNATDELDFLIQESFWELSSHLESVSLLTSANF